ncbi:threonine aldolase [Nitzschia inconspicua]|uniref:Threonine aldolase n=1 Tax=Nitzschia inconspicua TaxID=303405 RepID=A0A9K3L0Q4_9STRA|nr:threonine aldolase [Nitzschia inconspicua]
MRIFTKAIRVLHTSQSRVRLTSISNSARQCCHRSRSFSSVSDRNAIVDLRSDTVTLPSSHMLQAATQAPLGDDVMKEDPTILEFEHYMADLFGKEKALFLPTASMANLVALLSHCNTRASEIIIGTESHINLWEGGNPANLGGIHTRQTPEDNDARLSEQGIMDCFRNGVDDHWPHTALLCLENTHNMCGGVALPKSYLDQIGRLAHERMNIPVHVDGSRIFNAAVAQEITVKDLCQHVDSVTICLSKGLGAPVGSVLVGETEFIRLARRARKRCGGGMRQAGVLAAMGMYAVQHNVDRMVEDHVNAKKLGKALKENGFYLLRDGNIDTNIVYFGLPESCTITREDFLLRLREEYGVKLTGGYSSGGKLFRAVTHMHIDDSKIDRAIEGMIALGNS